MNNMDEEINLLDYYFVLKKRWKIIFYLCFFTGIASIIVSFQLPKIYQAKATIFVIQEQTGVSSILSQIPISIPGVGGAGSDYIVALLKSESIREKVINDLKLNKNKIFIGEKPEKITRDKLLKKLKDVTKIEDDKRGSITVKVDTTNRYLSADITNCYIKMLNKSIKTVATTNREFLEDRLKEVKERLKKAEEDLRNFQEKNKALSLDKQAEELISSYVDLQSQKIANQISLGQVNAVAKASGSIENLVRLETEKVSLKTRNDELEKNINILEKQFQVMPTIGLKLARLTREVKLQNIIFETLLQQYELAKVQEVKDNAKFQVIDVAYPPEKHYKPKKKIIVMMSGLLSLFLGVFMVFLLEYIENASKTRKNLAQ